MDIRNFITPNDVVLVVAPHADDEVLGAGGLLSLAQFKCHVNQRI